MAEVSEGQRVQKGTKLRVWEKRRALLGPFAGTLLIDFPEQLDELYEDTAERLAAEGIDVVRLPSYDRGEWLGVFDFEVEIVVEVVGFHAAKGKSEEEVQEANLALVLKLLIVVVIVVGTSYIVDRGADAWEKTLDLAPAVFPLIAVALGFLAIALLAREIRKVKALTP